MATSGNDHRPPGQPASRHSPAHASSWSPRWLRRRWRDHRFFTSALITLAVIATVSGATVAARPASEAIAASGGSFGSVASDPSVATDPDWPPSMSPLTSPTSPFPTSPGRSLVTFPNQTIGPAVGTTDPATVSVLAAGGIPATALDAYRRAAAAANPACGITWPLLAAIGRVESNHGRFAGATLHSDGSSTPPIIGIRLDGSRSVVVRDTDGGRLDGDPTYDHAVGPMQFIPSTWAVYRADGNGDGRYDPFNIYDAAAATATYLCQAGGNLRTGVGQQRAVWSYNPSTTYVSEVLALEAAYAAGAGIVVPVPPAITQPLPPPVLPPVNPAPPLAASPSAHAAAPHASRSPTAKPTATAHSTRKPPTSSPPTGSASSSSSSSSAPSPAPGSSSSSSLVGLVRPAGLVGTAILERPGAVELAAAGYVLRDA